MAANHMIQADLESSNAQLSTGQKFPFLVIYALAPKVYFGHISLIIAASHMIQTHADRSIAGLHFLIFILSAFLQLLQTSLYDICSCTIAGPVIAICRLYL